jgi:LysM repeat protein
VKALFLLLLACAIFGGAGYYTYDLFVKPQVELKREKDAPATPAPPDPTIPDYEKCANLAKKGQIVEARKAFEEFLERFPQSSKLEDARNALGEINSTIFLTPLPTPEKEVYLVKSGDVLNTVARRTNSTVELIMRANALEGTMLRIGQKLLLPPSDFSVVISRKRQKVTLLNQGKFFKQYPIQQMPAALQAPKKGAAAAKQVGKVVERIAWVEGNRVTIADKNYASATHWISVSLPHCTLYAEPPAGSDPKGASKPPSGLAVSAEAASEMAALLSRGNPVTLE